MLQRMLSHCKGCIFGVAIGYLVLMTCCNNLVVSGSTMQTSLAPEMMYGGPSMVTKFLQTEITAMATAHNSINTFLRQKKIAIGETSGSLRTLRNDHRLSGGKLVVALSDDSNNIECRVALERAPIGSKCIAPCGCSGSQRWIQFAVLNRMRRTDPSQWKVCQTCQQPFDYSAFIAHGGEMGNLISIVLDNPVILRSTLGVVAALVLWEGTIGKLSMRVLLSRAFWNLYPKWSRIVHLPLVLKFWGGKVLLQYFYDNYLVLEKLIAKSLTEMESSIIEKRLPVTVTAE